MTHFKQVCSCGQVIAQCRCTNCDRITTVVPDGCEICEAAKAKATEVLVFKSYPVSEATLQDLKNRFTYHAPKPDQPCRYEHLRDTAFSLARDIVTLTKQSAEQTLALRKLEEAIFWANAAIARNE